MFLSEDLLVLFVSVLCVLPLCPKGSTVCIVMFYVQTVDQCITGDVQINVWQSPKSLDSEKKRLLKI